jgi:hypothetical protein
MKTMTKMALGCGGLTIISLMCGTCGYFAYKHNEQVQATYGALTVACSGQPVPGAAAYTPGPGPHKVVRATQGSGGSWSASENVPQGWLGTGVADTSLVLCELENRSEQLDTCTLSVRTGSGANRRYRDQDFTRTRERESYRLVAAATGQTIAEGVLRGEDPNTCYSWRGDSPSSSDFIGELPERALELWMGRATAGESDSAFTYAAGQTVIVSGTAGGTNDARQYGGACSGGIPQEPQHALHVAAPGHLALVGLADSAVDLVLAVRLPDGQMLCNDDYDRQNPGLEADVPAGDVSVFVGTYAVNAGNPAYRLRVSGSLPPREQ